MAITLRCSCGSESKLTAKVCSKCGTAFPKKGRKYKVTLRMDGKKVTRTVTSVELARGIEAKLKVDIARGDHQLVKRAAAPTLAEVWKRYWPWAEANKKSAEDDRWNYERHLRPRFGDKRLDQISPFAIDGWAMGLKKSGLAPATVRHQTILLNRLFVMADQWNLYTGPNPVKKARSIKVNNQRTEYLNADQLARLTDVLEHWPCRTTACLIKFLMATGVRLGETFRLTWKDVDLQQKLMVLRDPKGGRDVVLPLSAKALAVLEEVPRIDASQFVFPGVGGQQRRHFFRPWSKIREAAGLPSDFRLHGLRHHFASALVSNGVSIFTVSKLLTHRNVATTMRYAHLSDEAMRDALEISDKNLTPQDSNIVPLRRAAQ